MTKRVIVPVERRHEVELLVSAPVHEDLLHRAEKIQSCYELVYSM